MRAKRMPSLKQLLATKPARPLKGKELERRRSEHKKMAASVDLVALAERKRKRGKNDTNLPKS